MQSTLATLQSNSPVPKEPSMSTTPTVNMPLLRYPKRKRNEVKYVESDAEVFSSDSEIDRVPLKKASCDSKRLFIQSPNNTQKARTKKSKPLQKHKIFPFMELPAEIRNKIYFLCLKDGDAMYITSKQRSHRRVAVRTTKKECSGLYSRSRSWRYGWNNNNSQADEEPETLQPLIPSILAVSKTIYSEAASILYSQPVIIADTRALHDFVAMLTPRAAGMLRDLKINSWCDSRSHKSVNFPAMTLLEARGVVNLERLNLDCRLGYFWSYGPYNNRNGRNSVPQRVARKVYRECYPWLHAVCNAKGAIDAALDVLQVSDDNYQGYLNSRQGQSKDKDEGKKSLEQAKASFKSELRMLLKRA